jgi:thioredoxin-dependent peroxiredoxin
MPYRPGDIADDFELLDQDNTPRRLTTLLADGPVVLFFYPAAMSRGCTMEACNFRDLAAEFRAVGAQRVGISGDPPAKQKEFARAHNFDYPLLSDPGNEVGLRFGIKRKLAPGPLSLKRLTYVIAPDRHILDVIHAELNMNEHAAKALEVLQSSRPA